MTTLSQPLVSICVMSYNHEKYIAQAIESILMQTVDFDYDIIIGDDNSTDNTRNILLSYQKKHPNKIKLIFNEKNLGIVPNFTNTLKECSGKYIATLDGDDYWTNPLKLQKQVDFLESHKDYSLVYHNAELHDHVNNSVHVRPFNPENNSRTYTVNDIFANWTITTCSVLCINNNQYKYLKKNLWFPTQDLPFFVLSASVGKIFYLAETMCVYRRVPTGSQNSEAFKNIIIHDSYVKCVKTLYKDFRSTIPKDSKNHTIALHYLHAAHKCSKENNISGQMHYLAMAVAYKPFLVYSKLPYKTKQLIYPDTPGDSQRINNLLHTISSYISLLFKISLYKNPLIKLKSVYNFLLIYTNQHNI